MSLNHFIKNGKNKGKTNNYFEIFAKGLESDYVHVYDELKVFSKGRTENINFTYETKGLPGDIFVNSDNLTCDFKTKEELFPQLINIDKENTSLNTTNFNGSVIVDDIVLRDGNVNLKDYIDQQIAILYATVGGTVSTLTGGG